ncbi:MAG: hypothetical protein JMDDDDMK_00797 [Acidobacteria bacterium]|nr:hypothetical protein [Acidobacteriota bacterium]
MTFAIDTNILVRSLHLNHPMQSVAAEAIEKLIARDDSVCVFPQNFYEFWVVATRPVEQNGLGMDSMKAQSELARLKDDLAFLPDVPAIYSEWEGLVINHAVIGRNAHDTRIIAAMKVHGVTHLLTFNGADFKRFQGITVVTPDEIVNQQSS